jgi:hypothetical protein
MSNKTDREAFEAMVRKENQLILFLPRWKEGCLDGCYKKQEIEEMWTGWKMCMKSIRDFCAQVDHE